MKNCCKQTKKETLQMIREELKTHQEKGFELDTFDNVLAAMKVSSLLNIKDEEHD